MTKRRLFVRAAMGIAVGSLLLLGPRVNPPTQTGALHTLLARVPLTFEANTGQTDDRVDFVARGPGYTMFLAADEAVLRLGKDRRVLRMKVVGANAKSAGSGVAQRTGRVNYFIGNDPAKWRTDVPTYGKVRYDDVYSGVDLVYYGNQRQLEYDFIVQPGASPDDIALRFDGADSMHIDSRGDLVLRCGESEVRQQAPIVYQEWKGARESIDGGYVLRADGAIGFEVGDYDSARPLVVDPILRYSTFLGGSDGDGGVHSATDATGSVYILGNTASADFPITPGAYQSGIAGGEDGFVMKLNPDGDVVVYSTFFGGTGTDYPVAMAVDPQGCVYIAGQAGSADFPVLNAFQPTFGGTGSGGPISWDADGFIAKLNAEGNALVYSTFLGGPEFEVCFGLAVDDAGCAVVAMYTEGQMPLANALDATHGGLLDGYVAKLTPEGDALVFGTYLGGSKNDAAYAVAVDDLGDIYVAGGTRSVDFPSTPNAPQPAYAGGPVAPRHAASDDGDAFVTKIASDGSGIIYSTFLGASGGYVDGDQAWGLAVDSERAAYVTGVTSVNQVAPPSNDFPLVNAYQSTIGYFRAAFLTKINPAGTAFVYSTYLGGMSGSPGGGDFPAAGRRVAVDAIGRAYVMGITGETDFPVVDPIQANNGGGPFDTFVSRFSPDGTELEFSTYLGGSGSAANGDQGGGVSVDAAGTIRVTGGTDSPDDFPLANPLQAEYGGGWADAFAVAIEFDEDGDGLSDMQETYGYTAANGVFVDLPAMGADPLRKDIFVEIDYMAGQQPQQEALDLIVTAFANAPLDNPDGSTGITLHCLMGNEVPYVELLGGQSTPGIYDWQGSESGYTYFQDIKDEFATESLAGIAHYCVFARQIRFADDTRSGISRGSPATGYTANEFIVSLGYVGVGGVGSVEQQAGTFMHELGHDLGLRHGGGDSTDNKPNYLSVMNGLFQFNGLVHDGAGPLFDYSCCKLPDLDENALDEQVGLNAGGLISGLGTAWHCGPQSVRTAADANGKIDWNCNEDYETGLQPIDINGDLLPIPQVLPGSVFAGFDDWAHIKFRGGAIGALGSVELPLPLPPASTVAPDELGAVRAAAFGPEAPSGLIATQKDDRVEIQWHKPPDGGSDKLTYSVYRLCDGDLEYLGNLKQTKFKDYNAPAASLCVYAVAAVDESGVESPAVRVVIVVSG